MNNGLHMDGYHGHGDPRMGSQTISTTKYANDYTSKQFKIDKKGQKQKRNAPDTSNIITRENL